MRTSCSPKLSTITPLRLPTINFESPDSLEYKINELVSFALFMFISRRVIPVLSTHNLLHSFRYLSFVDLVPLSEIGPVIHTFNFKRPSLRKALLKSTLAAAISRILCLTL